MKLFRIFAIVALAMISGASAQAGVVLSNMGTNGFTPGGDNNGSFDNDGTKKYALGFQVGPSDFTVTGLNALMQKTNFSADGTNVAVTFGIYSSTGTGSSRMPSSLVGSASTVGNVSNTKGVVSFDFTSSGVTLSANQYYFAVVQSVSGTTGASWYNMAGVNDPDEVNSSGFQFYRYRENLTGSWTNGGVNGLGFALLGVPSGQVPEPALTSLLCLGGVALIRRRMKK